MGGHVGSGRQHLVYVCVCGVVERFDFRLALMVCATHMLFYSVFWVNGNCAPVCELRGQSAGRDPEQLYFSGSAV